MVTIACRYALFAVLFLGFNVVNAQDPKRITIIYDAFGAPSALQKDWGFAALVEYGGKRILFDTGNNGKIFAHNVKQLGIDLTKLDAAVISHRHGDHTSGLSHLIDTNPGLKIYAPNEGGFFKRPFPQGFLTAHAGLPAELRYYDGKKPEQWVSGSPWEKGNFEIVSKPTEIFPGFFVFSTTSQKPGTIEMEEVSLAMRTHDGFGPLLGTSR